MSKQLQTSGFEWMTDDERDDLKHLSCILEVDLDYPENLHNLHNEYRLAPEGLKIGNVAQLISNLNNKTNYVVHYEYPKSTIYSLNHLIHTVISLLFLPPY